MGDVFWYLAQACIALDVDFQTVVVTNMMKLAARYPKARSTSCNRKFGKKETSDFCPSLNKWGSFFMAAQKGFIYEENTADFLKPAGIVPQSFKPAGAGHDQPDLMIQFKGKADWN